MLRRFESIRDSGIFEHFSWNIRIPDFEHINLIYGTNGAGKTSLARTLDDLGPDGDGYRRVSIHMSDADKTTNDRTSSQQHDPEFDRIFVFSDRYVLRSHNFAGDPESNAVITLGERTVEDEKRIAELQDLITLESARLAEAAASAHRASQDLQDVYQDVARSVVNALSGAGGRYRSNSNYNSGVARRQFAGSHDSWALLSDRQKTADRATANSDSRSKVPVKSYSLSVRPGLRSQAQTLVAASPASIVLDTLQRNSGAASWVEDGRRLHEGLEQCIFCGGSLTEDRKRQLEQHFSDEVVRIQRDLDVLINEVKAIQASLQGLLGDDAIAGSLFEDLRNTFRSAHSRAKGQQSELRVWLAGLLGTLETKRANVIAEVDYAITEPPSVDGVEAENALKDHNQRIAQHAELQRQAAERVELHLLKESESKVAELDERARDAARQKDEAEETLRRHRENIATLKNVEGDPLPSATVMSRELTRILGRNELGFELMEDGKHYRITRHGAPARGLSTGERTAITLIHFLEHVKRVRQKDGKPIVVIDDPVSSLDSGAAMGISTYIWSETISKDHIEQVFLLTHNFELFRQWDIQIDGLHGKKSAASQRHSSNRYELIALHKDVDGAVKRVPAFITWPPNPGTRTKVRSSYHHAFITAARAHQELMDDDSMEKKLDALLLYPNMLRRMLETFLAFKSPASIGNFTGAMRDIVATLKDLGYEGDADAMRLQLTRFTHASSHAESPETDMAVNPDEITAVIGAVFTFMNAIDKPHFEGLCKVIGKKPSDLLPNPQQSEAIPTGRRP